MKINQALFPSSCVCFALATVWIACATVHAADAASGPTPFERALVQWRQGQKESAIKEFLQIDWTKTAVFSARSPLATREKDLGSMSEPAREKLLGDVMLSLNDLKQLARATKEKAATSTDPQESKRILEKLDQCATALNRPESLKILQLTAQAIKKMAVQK